MSIRVLSPGDNGPVTQTNTTRSSAPADERASSDPSWIWVWTFTWCEETTEITTLAGAGTGLDWLWNWTWNWACEGTDAGDTGSDTAPAVPDREARPDVKEAAPPSALPTSAAPASSDGPASSSLDSAVTFPAADLESLLPVPWATLNIDLSTWPRLPFSLAPISGGSAQIVWPTALTIPPAIPPAIPPVDVAVDVTIPSVAVPMPPSPSIPAVVIDTATGAIEIELAIVVPGAPSAPLSLVPAHERRPQPAPGPDAQAARAVAGSQARGVAPTSPAGAQRSQHGAQASAGASSRLPARGPLPFELPPLQAASSSASAGGSAPGLLVFAFAAIIGFFVLAAPGLGRRIRLARLPSPRRRYGSSIDRPG